MWSSFSTEVVRNERDGLSLFFATCCFVDLFGIFPVVALPRAIIECGWMGIPLAFVIFFIQIYTAIMLGRCWMLSENMSTEISRKTRYPYAAMAELAFGRTAGSYVNVLLGLTVFFGSVPNLLLAAQNLELIGLKLTAYQTDYPYCYWMIILGAAICPIMWIGSPKDLKWLGCVSVLIVISSAVLTWYCLIDGSEDEDPVVPDFNWEGMAIAYGILAFQFDIHPMVLTIQMDMKNKNQLGSAILFAFLVSGTLFLVTTAICYSFYGTAIHYNALQGLPPSSALYVDLVLVTLQIGLSTVIGASPLFQGLEDCLHIGPGLGWKRCVLRTVIVLFIVLVGEVIPRFDLIMGLFGALLMGQLMFIIPPLIYTKLRIMQTAVQPALLSIPRRLFGYGTMTQLLRPENSPLLGRHSRADVPSSDDHPAVATDPLESEITHPLSRTRTSPDSCWSFLSLESALDGGPLSFCEKSTNFLLVLLGLTATGTSTFFAISGTLKYANFAPPCITNVTLASRLIYTQL